MSTESPDSLSKAAKAMVHHDGILISTQTSFASFVATRRFRGNRVDYNCPDLGSLFGDITIDSQDSRVGRMPHHKIVDEYGFDHQFLERRWSSDEKTGRRNSQRPDINGDFGFGHRLTLARTGSAGLPFHRAFKDVHRRLEQAEEFYNACLMEYDNDMQPIRNYSSAEDLINIWLREWEE
jgi:hypothetical protein